MAGHGTKQASKPARETYVLTLWTPILKFVVWKSLELTGRNEATPGRAKEARGRKKRIDDDIVAVSPANGLRGDRRIFYMGN